MDKLTEQELKDMKLHGKMEFGDFRIHRVIGGWIYWGFNSKALESDKGSRISCAMAGVFVPEK